MSCTVRPRSDTAAALFATFTGSPGFERDISTTAYGLGNIAVLPDGRTLEANDHSGSVRLVDLDSGREIAQLSGNYQIPHSDQTLSDVTALSHDGRYVAVGVVPDSASPTGGGVLTEWDLTARSRRFPDVNLNFKPTSIAFSPDGSLIAVSGGSDARVQVWDAHTGVLVRDVASVAPPPGIVDINSAGVAFTADGSLAVGSAAGFVRLVDPRTGNERTRFGGPAGTSDWNLKLSPDGRSLIGFGHQGVMIWDVGSGPCGGRPRRRCSATSTPP